MRPVEKTKSGDTVEYTDSANKQGIHTIRCEYNPYSTAKDPLVANLGNFCSYCEEPRATGDIHVEHIEPKSKEGAMCKWENFLLSCNICNFCKLDTDVDIKDIHFPHLDNTYLYFIYDESGWVKVNPVLPEEEYKKAQNLYDLVKLGRDPWGEEAVTKRDFRWKSIYETWNIAKRYLEKYESGKLSTEDIMEMSRFSGHWSIWFTVFKSHDEIRKALIGQTPGTCSTCFDAENHFEPIARK